MIDGFRMMIGFFLSFFAGGSPGGGGKREGEFASPMEKIDIYPFFLGGEGVFFAALLLLPPTTHIYRKEPPTKYKTYIHPRPGLPHQMIPRVTHSISITVWSIFSPDPSPFVHLIGIMMINTIMSFFLIYRVWDTLQLISLRVCFFSFSFFSHRQEEKSPTR